MALGPLPEFLVRMRFCLLLINCPTLMGNNIITVGNLTCDDFLVMSGCFSLWSVGSGSLFCWLHWPLLRVSTGGISYTCNLGFVEVVYSNGTSRTQVWSAVVLPLCLARYLPRTMIKHKVTKTTTATTPPIRAWSVPCCPRALGSEKGQRQRNKECGWNCWLVKVTGHKARGTAKIRQYKTRARRI